VVIFGATGTVGHALVKMIKDGHLGMKDLKVGGGG
jgi:aspartate-semialdehyde dehydrogenase